MTIFPTGVSRDVLAHFLSRVHHNKWHVRVFTAFCIVVLIGFLQGWRWAAFGLIWLSIVWALEYKNSQQKRIQEKQVVDADQAGLDRVLRKLFIRISAIAAVYTIAAIALSFGNQNAKVLGLILSASVLMNITGQHVLHPRLIVFSLPVPAIGFFICVLSLALPQSHLWAVILVALVYILQTALLTLTAIQSDRDLLEAKRIAVDEALARSKAESTSQTKSNFLANMSHELRTPLNAVIGYGEILKENAQLEGRIADVKDIDKVLVSAGRLLRLVGEILDVSKIEAGAMSLTAEEFDVGKELMTAVDMVRPQSEAKGNRLVTHFAPDLGIALSDPLRFSQCVLNLLSNAAKFTKDGEITLDAKRVTSPSGDRILVSVMDTGIGISLEQQKLLFQPFVQADDSVTKKYGGTGLGLSLSLSLAKLMGGDITLTSELEKGSRFDLTISAELIS